MKTIPITLFLVLSPFISSKTNAFEFDRLRNDKEFVTHAYSEREYRRVIRSFGISLTQASTETAKIMNHLESRGELCELPLASVLSGEFGSTHSLLILLRSGNLIDDLFFEIMDTADFLEKQMKAFHANRLFEWEKNEAIKMAKEQKIQSFDLELVYSSIKGYSIHHPGCTLNSWNSSILEMIQLAGGRENLRLLNGYALEQGIIGEDEFVLAEFFREQQTDLESIHWNRYFDLNKKAKNRLRPLSPKEEDYLPNQFSSKPRNRKKGITYRQSLYYRFNSSQVLMISNVMKKLFERMDAEKAEVIFSHSGGSETIAVSPMGQYYLARNLLKKDLEELNRSSLFNGISVSHEDLVAASLETGLINGSVLDSVLKIDDIWNPEISQWDRISRFAFRVTGSATVFLPPPYNVISSTALVFIDGILNRNKKRSRQSESLYDLF